MKSFVFLLGLFSLFFLPNFYGLKIVDAFIIILIYIMILKLFIKKNQIINKRIILGFFIVTLFLIWSAFGAVINTESYKGIFISIRYFEVLILVFLFFLFFKDYYLYFEKGFIYSAYTTTLWMIIDTIWYYTYGGGYSINELVFSNLNIGNDHVLTNRAIIGDFPLLLRASGFGWDPGGIAPALLIAFIITDHNKIYSSSKYFFLIGIVLSISKTTLLMTCIYLIYKLIRFYSQKLASIFILLNFFLIFSFSFYISGYPTFTNKDGNIRHIKYPSSVVNLVYAPLPEIIFGYGYRGTMEFYYQHVDWFNIHQFNTPINKGKNKIVESTFSNMFLYAGLVGIIINLYLFLVIIFYANKQDKALIYILLLSFIGYTFENFWTNFIIYSLFFKYLSRNKNDFIHTRKL